VDENYIRIDMKYIKKNKSEVTWNI